ncbi:MAG: NAD(P)/FAD-dependent oxidoreductase [Spirochaetales bacterium]|nr:NAD(P)/FAD-dependent oxidoreductase [Spirochaetales bacterium]
MQKFLQSLEKKLIKKGFANIKVSLVNESVLLEGEVDSLDQKLEAGYIAAGFPFNQVISNVSIKNLKEEPFPKASLTDESLNGSIYDVVIIGAGVIGCSIASKLSAYNLSVLLLEKESDVGMHASSRNDGVIHPGIAAKPGSLKAKYNVRGNEAYTKLCEDLNVPFFRPGSLIVFGSSALRLLLPIFKMRARANGVKGTRYISRKSLMRKEPYIEGKQYGAFYMPTTGQLSPYRLVVALAEHAVENGVKVSLDTLVSGFEKDGDGIYSVATNKGSIKAGLVINSAGAWADKIAEFAGDKFYSLHFRKGVDVIVDRKKAQFLNHIMARPSFNLAKTKTKGGGLIKTIEGNVLIGPTAHEVVEREDYSTSSVDISQLSNHFKLNKKIEVSDIITFFAGVRACTYKEDFIIEKSKRVRNFIHVAGIQSPGLASAPAIAEDVVNMSLDILSSKMVIDKNPNYSEKRKFSIPETRSMDAKHLEELVKKNPKYGTIVCRCEQISEGEIRDVFRSPLVPVSLDSIKRRTGAITGRCHGGFCTPRIFQIIQEETGLPVEAITKKGGRSPVILKKTKGDIDYSYVKTSAQEDVQ